MEARLLGLAATLATTASWSLAPVFISRASAKTRIDPLAFNEARMIVAAVVLVPLASMLYGFPLDTPWRSARFEAGVWVGGVFSTVAGDSFFVYSVSRVGASVALPVSYLFVVWSALYDYARGLVGARVLVAAAVAVAGVWLVARGGRGRGRRDLAALAAAVAASLVWAASMYAYKAATQVANGVVVAAARAVATALVMAPLAPRLRGLRPALLDTVASGILGYAVGTLTFLAALSLLPASVVGVGLALTPLLTQLLSSPMAGERLEKGMVVGGALLTAAIALIEL